MKQKASRRHVSAVVTVLTAGSAANASGPTVLYERVPSPAVSAIDISPDGRFVVGSADLDGDDFGDSAYIWDRVLGTVTLADPGPTTAISISHDGTRIVGTMPDPADPDPVLGVVAGLWEAGVGWQSLGYLPNALECPSRSNALAISGDGTTVVGLSWDQCDGRAFTWTQATGMQELQVLANGKNRASQVSADGSVIVGFAQGNSSRTPAIWDRDTLTGFTADPTANTSGEFHGVRDDGQIVVGSAYMGGLDGWYDAVTWTAAGGFQVIGQGSILGGWAGRAYDIADTGTIVGQDSAQTFRRGWIQPAGQGDILLLNDWATAHGADIEGNDLLQPWAITPDGLFIVGSGRDTNGQAPWVLQITPPCPADMDGNGTLNLDDVNIFAAAFSAADLLADLDANGVLNLDDVNRFANSFVAGCP